MTDPALEDPMSTARDRVAQEIWQRYVVEVGRSLPTGLADQLADAAITAHLEALAESGHAVVVELPEQMTDRGYVAERLRPLPMWQVGDAWTCLRDPDLIEFEADSQQVYGEFSVRDARDLAAALLAAAAEAEAS